MARLVLASIPTKAAVPRKRMTASARLRRPPSGSTIAAEQPGGKLRRVHAGCCGSVAMAFDAGGKRQVAF
jgi:hypothetical protein